MPKWSPDGTKIVYLEVLTNSRSLGDLVVIAADGVLIGRYSVATVTPTGIPIEGMRAVESVGWFDVEHVFAVGGVNPYVDEYRTISITSQAISGFGGFDFSTCSTAGIVAFWEPVFPQNSVMKLVTSVSKAPLFQFPDANALATLHVPITWDKACKSVAFIDPRPPIRLVAISVAGRGRSVLQLPGDLEPSIVRAIPQGFLVGSVGQLLYEPKTSELEPTPPDMVQTLQREVDRHRHIGEILGASEADWWRR